MKSDLAARISRGDEAAFKQLYQTLHDQSVEWAFFYLKSRELAEEAAGDVFLHLWQRRTQLAEVRNLRAYLFMAIRNCALHYLRRTPRLAAQNSIEVHPQATPEDIFVDAEYDRLIRQGIDTLPEKCREVFSLVLVGRLKQNETARVLGISVKTVEAHVSKAYKRVATHVKGQYGEV